MANILGKTYSDMKAVAGSLPDLALLSIRHYQEEAKDFWHWVVLKRENGQSLVLDSASDLPSNIRYDFDAMQPKWFIEVEDPC